MNKIEPDSNQRSPRPSSHEGWSTVDIELDADFADHSALDQIKILEEKAQSHPLFKLYSSPSVLDAGGPAFTPRLFKFWKYMRSEPETFAFAAVQWIAIVLTYYVFVLILEIIPSSLSRDFTTNILVFIWFTLCIGLASIVIALGSAAMGLSYYLRQLGYESTFRRCLLLSIARFGPMWKFSWLDNWITALQILERLPKKDDPTPWHLKLLREVIYYAWKCSVVGVVPSILNGRTFVESLKESFHLLIKHFKDIVLLRAGYSLYCWWVGIVGYLITLLALLQGWFPTAAFTDHEFGWYAFYKFAGIPIAISAGLVAIFLRPVFIFSSCEMYAKHIGFKLAGFTTSEITRGKRTILIAAVTISVLLVAVYTITYFYVQLVVAA